MRVPYKLEVEPFGTYPEFDDFEGFDTGLADQVWLGEVNRRSPEYIRWVQQSLNRIMGLRLAVDGIVGPKTRSAIRSFQERFGLQVDGIVGPQTERALIAVGAGPPPGAAPSVSPPPYGPRPGVTQAAGFIVGGVVLPAPSSLTVTNFIDPRVHRFRGSNRQGRTVNALVIHETVTRSVADTVSVLINRNLGVHLIMGPNGEITQHGDLADDTLAHAAPHNSASVGIEVVNPYYPEFLRTGLPWTRIIQAGWAHKGQYVVPTRQQAEAVAKLVGWITSSAARGLSIPRRWLGLSNGRLAMSRVPGADRANPGIYAHTYFAHADGAWLVLYAWLRLERGLSASQAYEEAIRLATTPRNYVLLPGEFHEFETGGPCSCPYPPPAKGLFSGPDRAGHRWYTPIYGDNLSYLSRNIMIRILATHGIGRKPSGAEIQAVMNAIRNHRCNRHLRGKMFLPRFSSDRCTGKGRYYGSIYIPFKFD